MEKEYVVKLDVYLGVLEARVINFNQLNTGTCKLRFELTSNKQALDLTDKKVTFEVTTPGGATLEDAILITDATQGKAECTLANDMIAEQGMHYAEINVYSKDNTKLFTFNKFRYIVNGQLGAKDITVDTRYSTLQELIFDVENLKNQSVIDTEAVAQMKNETDLMHKEVIVKHGDVEVKHQEVVTLAQSVKDDASRTGSNAQQVSTDKGIVTKAKNEVVAKHDEVLKTAGVIAKDKAIVEQAKTETLGYKNDVETMKNDVQQLVTDSTEDLILEGNRQVVRVSTEGTTQVNLAKAEVTKATQQATVATEQAGIAQSHAETAQGELSKVTAEGVKQVKAVSDKGVEQVQAVATEGAKQIELAKTEVIKAEAAATLATTEADRAGAQAQEKVNSKIGHNGVFDDTIFNFIENKVVQDGLIGAVFENKPSIIEIKKASKYTIQFVGKYNLTHGIYSGIFGMYHKNGTPAYYYLDSPSANEQALRLRVGEDVPNTTAIVKNYNELFTIKSNLIIQVDETESTVTIVLNGIKNTRRYTLRNAEDTFNLYLLKTAIEGSDFNGDVAGLLVYNRLLTPQEIQHNFSVLNNESSIKELHTTDSTGKTSILKLGSDTDHVVDRAGRTQEQINRIFYKRMCKEIPSPSGEPITVENGEEGYVLSAEVKGNTKLFKRAKGSQGDWIAIPNDEVRDTVAFEYKIDSTQAIISNNGETYPIYANEEDKANKKVILLPFAEDKVTLNEDGSGTWVDSSITLVLNGIENWKAHPSSTEANKIYWIDGFSELLGKADILSTDISHLNKYITNTYNKSITLDVNNTIRLHNYVGVRWIQVRDDSCTTLESFKSKLANNNLIIEVKPNTPITTTIDKSIMPTILCHDKTNILEAGGAVKPSSFKVTVPVDRIAEQQAEIDEIKKQLGAVAALQLAQIN